jgi:hypothetical protein
LKTKGIWYFSDKLFRWLAVSNTISSLSTTHGPAINRKLSESWKLIPGIFIIAGDI